MRRSTLLVPATAIAAEVEPARAELDGSPGFAPSDGRRIDTASTDGFDRRHGPCAPH